ncbi:MAG TPA: hypothetical protein VG368_02380 [Acidimicrobiales bacterium]|jgi:hypothetical protein|nr:hypothetical protein [Acidimicrobiales bacterium]
MGKREGQQVACAVLELEDAREAPEASGQDVSAVVKRIDDVVARLAAVSSVPAGFPVADAATYLQRMNSQRPRRAPRHVLTA